MAKNNNIEIQDGRYDSEDVFLVLNTKEQDDLIQLGYRSHVIDAKEGGLAAWVASRGIGDGDGGRLTELFEDVDIVVLLLPLVTLRNAKTKKFVEALSEHLELATNTKLIVPELQAGESVRAYIQRNGNDLFTEAVASVEGRQASDSTSIEPEAQTAAQGKYLDILMSGDGMAATAALAMLEDHFEYAYDREQNLTIATPRQGTDILPISYDLDGTDIVNWLRDTYNQFTDSVIPYAAETGAIKTMGSKVVRSKKYIKTVKRVFKENGNVWIDLGNDTADCIRLNQEGWEVLPQLPEGLGSSFIRDESVRWINTPQTVNFKDSKDVLDFYLRPYINTSEDDWILLISWLVNHVLDNESPILMFLAEAGLGKSTACRALQFAAEGGFELEKLSKMPTKPDDLIVALAKQRVGSFDNISKISSDMSDTWCQSTTGLTYSKRKLRTDNETVTLKTRARIIANAISVNELRDDVKERLVNINLTQNIAQQMKTEELENFLVKNHATVYGALLSIAVEVLKVIDGAPVFETKGREGLRMQAYARVLWSLDQLWGTNGIHRYKESLNLSADDAYEDPLTMALLTTMARYGKDVPEDYRWVGSLPNIAIMAAYGNSTFLDRVTGSHDSGLSARGLPAEISRRAAGWKRLGIQVGESYRKTDRISGKKATHYEVQISGKTIYEELRTLNFQMLNEGRLENLG